MILYSYIKRKEDNIMQTILDALVFFGIGYFAYKTVKKGVEYDEKQDKDDKGNKKDDGFFFFWWL